MERAHWIIRVGDGKNFKKSKCPIWGMKRCHKTCVKKMNKGDVLWFLTSKAYGGMVIGMSEFVGWNDRQDEPIIQMKTISNYDNGWEGDEKWDIQIEYTNLYLIEKQNIAFSLQCASTIMSYCKFIEDIKDQGHDLHQHFHNFTFYAQPKVW